MVTLTLIALLLVREVLSGLTSPRLVRMRRALHVAIIPLSAVFAVTLGGAFVERSFGQQTAASINAAPQPAAAVVLTKTTPETAVVLTKTTPETAEVLTKITPETAVAAPVFAAEAPVAAAPTAAEASAPAAAEAPAMGDLPVSANAPAGGEASAPAAAEAPVAEVPADAEASVPVTRLPNTSGDSVRLDQIWLGALIALTLAWCGIRLRRAARASRSQ
jgi:hypothetical protein